MTLIAASIAVDRPDAASDALARAAQAKADGADLVEWRMDMLAPEPGAVAAACRLIRESPLPCIVTVRTAEEGGGWDGDEADRISFMEAVCTGECPPRYIDVELVSLERSANLRQKVLLCVAHPAQVREGLPGLIVSAHDFAGRPADLSRRIAQMWGEPACAVAKVAWRARSLRDVTEAVELLAMRAKPTVALCMGEFGLMTRVLAPKFGAFLTYAHVDGDGATAPGQPTVRELVAAWGIRRICRSTAAYGVIGWPVAQSLSPQLHNGWFAAHSLDARYFPLPVAPGWESFKATVSELRACAALDFRGASVTHPHKEHLLRYVLECGGEADAASAAIGAANTLVIGLEGHVRALNTDAPAVAEVMGGLLQPGARWRGARVAVIGAGGAGRAAAYAMALEGSDVTILARRPEQSAEAAADLSARGSAERAGRIASAPLARFAGDAFDAIIHATPVGMKGGPDESASPLPDIDALGPGVAVLDMVSVPEETPLVVAARARGARVATGMSLLRAQARRQFMAWTGRDPESAGGGAARAQPRTVNAPAALCLCAIVVALMCAALDRLAHAAASPQGRSAAQGRIRAPEFGIDADPILFEEIRTWCEGAIAIAPAEWPDVCAAHRDYLAAWAAAERQRPAAARARTASEVEACAAIDGALIDRLSALLGEGSGPALESWRRARRCALAEQLARESGGAPDALRACARKGVPVEVRRAVAAYARASEDSACALVQLRARADAGEDVDGLRASERDIRARWMDAEASLAAACAAAGPAGENVLREMLVGAYPDLTREWMARARLMQLVVARMPALEPQSRIRAQAAVDAYVRARWAAAEREVHDRRAAGTRLAPSASRSVRALGDAQGAGARGHGVESLFVEEDAALLAALAESVGAERAQAIRALAYAQLADSMPAIARIVGEDGAAEVMESLPRATAPSAAVRIEPQPELPAAYALPDALAALRPALAHLGARMLESRAQDAEDRRALEIVARDDSSRWARDVAPVVAQLATVRGRAEQAVREGNMAAFDAAAASFMAIEARCRDAVARHDGETWAALGQLAMRPDGMPAWVSQLRLARSLEVQAPPSPVVSAIGVDDGESVAVDLRSLARSIADPDAWGSLDPQACALIEAGLARVLSDGASARRASLEAAVDAERARIRADLALREVDALVRQHGSPPAGNPAAFAIQQARMRSAAAGVARAQAVRTASQAESRSALAVVRALEDSLSRAGSVSAAWEARRFLVAGALADGVPAWSAARMLLMRSERDDWRSVLDGESARATADLWAAAALAVSRSAQSSAAEGDLSSRAAWRAARGQMEQSAERILFLAALPGVKAPSVPMAGSER